MELRDAPTLGATEAVFAMLSASPDYCAIVDETGTAVFVNPAARRLLGVDPEAEVSGLDWRTWFAPPARSVVTDEIAPAIEQLGWWRGDLALLAHDGREVPVAMVALSHPGDGTHRWYSLLAQDRSDVKGVEASEAWFRSIAVHTSDLLSVRSRSGELVYVSPSVHALLGVTPEEYASAGLDRHHPDDLANLQDALADLAGSPGASTRAEVRIRHADGEYRTFALSIANLLDDPVVSGFVINGRDVSDQRNAERAVVRHAAALRAIVQSSPLAILAFDGEGNVQLWNEASSDLFGRTAREVIGRPLHPSEGAAVFESLIGRVFAGDDVDAEEVTWIDPGGTPLDLSIWMAPIRDAGDRIVTALAVVTDVTERRRSERKIRRTNEALSAIVENSPLGIIALDQDLVVRTWNPAAERIFGYAAHEVLGQKVPADHAHLYLPLIERHAEESRGRERHESFEMSMARRDGEWIDLSVSAAVVPDLESDQISLLALISDVTERRTAASRLHASEARYRAIVDDQVELICRYTPDGRLTFVNEAFARAFGRPSQDLLGSYLENLLPVARSWEPPATIDLTGAVNDAVSDAVDEAVDDAIGMGDPGVDQFERELLLPDGTVRWIHWTHRAVHDQAGAVSEYQAVGRDVTKERRTQALLADQAAILEMAATGRTMAEVLSALCEVVEREVPGARCGVLLRDETGLELRFAAAPSLPEPVVDAISGIRVSPNAPAPGVAAFTGSLVSADIAGDPDGEAVATIAAEYGIRSCWALPIRDYVGANVLGALSVYAPESGPSLDEHRATLELAVHLATIALERRANEDRLAHQAQHDPLTDLPNRALFLEFLNKALARVRRHRTACAVIFLDLDRFKNVNDSLGHNAGDMLLVTIGERLRSALRPGDTVARFGGDEFTVLCEDLTIEDARRQAADVAERLLQIVNEPFVLAGEEAFLGASVGIAVADTGEERADALLRDADAAMYRAKEKGKGRWEVFDDRMRRSAVVRLELENALHRAVDRDEFMVFYQPIVSLAEGRAVGAEALVRWIHPARGLITPREFIEVAEETGLIVPIGAHVLDEVCREIENFGSEFPESFFVSVNLSARQLSQPDLVSQFEKILASRNVDPGRISIEITESAVMEDVESGIGVIHDLRALGLHLSIDDFGTGYSSLGYLKQLPVDAVKIDRSFVDGLGTDGEDSAIVTAVVSLGHALGLTVVAEGVETDKHVRELVDLGCDQAQGFFFAPPQPVEDLRTMLRSARRNSQGSRLVPRA